MLHLIAGAVTLIMQFGHYGHGWLTWLIEVAW